MQHITVFDVFLQAADVLIDEEGVFEACGILADRYLAPEKGVPAMPFQHTGRTLQPDRTDVETCRENAVEVCFLTVCRQQALWHAAG